MPKVSDEHRERVRDQILDAAIECFVERGVRLTTMADIIAESGLSAGAIYGYFSSKQELAVAAARRVLEGRIGEVAAAADSGPISPAEVLRTISTGFDHQGIHPGLVVQMWGEAASDPEFRAIAAGVFRTISILFHDEFARWAAQMRNMPAAEADRWATDIVPVLLSMGQGLILQRTLLDDFDRDRYLAAVDALFR